MKMTQETDVLKGKKETPRSTRPIASHQWLFRLVTYVPAAFGAGEFLYSYFHTNHYTTMPTLPRKGLPPLEIPAGTKGLFLGLWHSMSRFQGGQTKDDQAN